MSPTQYYLKHAKSCGFFFQLVKHSWNTMGHPYGKLKHLVNCAILQIKAQNFLSKMSLRYFYAQHWKKSRSISFLTLQESSFFQSSFFCDSAPRDHSWTWWMIKVHRFPEQIFDQTNVIQTLGWLLQGEKWVCCFP